MKRILTAVVIAGCASLFLAALPAQARLSVNGLAALPTNARLAVNGVRVTGLDFSRIGQKALGK